MVVKNDTYFEKIDSSEKAYFLGLLFADGSVTKRNEIRLSLIDKEPIELLAKRLKCTGKIREQKLYTGRTYYMLTASSWKLSGFLREKGLVSGNKDIVKLKNCVEELFLKDFWRGIIDGDGSIVRKLGHGTDSVTLSGSIAVCEEFRLFLNKLGLIPGKISKSSVYSTGIYGAQAKKFLETVYSGDPKIARKAKVVSEIVR